MARLDSVDTLSVLLKCAFMCVSDSSSFAGGVNAVFDTRIMCPDLSLICPQKREMAIAMGDGRRRATWDRRSPERWREFG